MQTGKSCNFIYLTGIKLRRLIYIYFIAEQLYYFDILASCVLFFSFCFMG